MRLCGAVMVLVLCTATSVAGRDTTLNLGLSAGNVSYGEGDNFPERNVIRLSPRMRFTTQTKSQRLLLSYNPGVKLTSNDDFKHYWDHQLEGEYQYEIDPRTSVTLADVYSDIEIINFGDGILPDGTVDVVSGAMRLARNNASVTFQHLFSPVLNMNLRVAQNFADFEDPKRHDSETVNGGANLAYSWTAKDQVGLGVQASYSSFDAAYNPATLVANDGQRNTNIHVIASWDHQFTARLRASITGGPNFGLYDSEKLSDQNYFELPTGVSPAGFKSFFVQADCPSGTLSSCGPASADTDDNTFAPLTQAEAAAKLAPLPPIPNPELSDLQINFFGTLGISYAGDDWRLGVNARRVESTQSGIGTATAVTSANLNLDWEPDPRWELAFNAGWSQRTSLVSSLAFTGDVDLRDSVYTDLNGLPVLESSSLPTRVVKQQVDRYQYRAWAQVRHRVFETRQWGDWWLRLSAEYIRVEESGTDSTNRYRIGAGVAYDLPPIEF